MSGQTLWWQRPGLEYDGTELHLAGRALSALAAQTGTPAFFYDAARIGTKLEMLHAALDRAGVRHRVFYAMKANRFAPLLTWLRGSGLCGIDACSPQELLFAAACGFEPDAVSYTATSVSDADLDVLAAHPGTAVNCDSLSSIRRLGRRCPGRSIGIRINPGIGVGYGDNQRLQYSGARTTKFGIYREQFEEALELARAHHLEVRRIHFHVGIGYLSGQLDLWEQVVEACLPFVDRVPGIESVNIGGGLGLPHRAGDRPLDLDRWAGIVARHFGTRGLEVWVEPGDFVVKDAGVLVLRVNTLERKRDTLFAGVDGGFNLAVEPFFYDLPCEPVPCRLPDAGAWAADRLQPVSLAGNINEALDVWAENVALPPLAEGDLLAFLNAGGYAAAMSSNHCMRGAFAERLLFPLGPA